MEPRHGVERRAVDPHRHRQQAFGRSLRQLAPGTVPRREESLVSEGGVLPGLHADEARTDRNGGQQVQFEEALVAGLNRGERLHHRHAAADQQKSVDGCHRDVENRVGSSPLLGAAEAQNDVRSDQGREEHHFRPQEDPHAQLLAVDIRADLASGRRFHQGGVSHISRPSYGPAAAGSTSDTSLRVCRRKSSSTSGELYS